MVTTRVSSVPASVAIAAAGPEVDTPEWWRRIERTPVSLDPDRATAQVIARMAELIRSSARDPLFRQYAAAAVAQFRGGPLWAAAGVDPLTAAGGADGRRERAIAESAWWWAHVYVRFVHHARMIWERLGERDQWQLLISPDAFVRMRPLKGDCAIFSMLIAAMLEVWGVPWELQTVAANALQPDVYSHVFPRVVLPDGRRECLDASHGDYPGWCVPARDVYRSQVWDRNGRPVADRGQAFQGLHAYAVRRRGFGDLIVDSGVYTADDYSEGGSYVPPSGPNPTQTFFPSGGSPSSGTNWGGVFANLLTQWSKIGGQVLAPQVTYTRGPNGQIIYSAPAGTPGGVPSSVLSGSGLGLSSTNLLLIGVGVVGLVAVLMASKR